MSNRHPVISTISSTNSIAGNAMNCCASRFGAFAWTALTISCCNWMYDRWPRIPRLSPHCLFAQLSSH
jgi:hypothetical protein